MEDLKAVIEKIVRTRFPESFLGMKVSALGGAHRPSLGVHFALGKDKAAWPSHIIHNDPGHTVFLVHAKANEQGNITDLELSSNIHGYQDAKTFKSDKANWRDIKKPTDIAGVEKNLIKYFDTMKALRDEYLKSLEPAKKAVDDFDDIWNLSDNQIKEMSDVKFKEVQAEYTKRNLHGENIVLLAKRYGTQMQVQEAETILAKHARTGHLTESLKTNRDKLEQAIIDVSNANTPAQTITTDPHSMSPLEKDPIAFKYVSINPIDKRHLLATIELLPFTPSRHEELAGLYSYLSRNEAHILSNFSDQHNEFYINLMVVDKNQSIEKQVPRDITDISRDTQRDLIKLDEAYFDKAFLNSDTKRPHPIPANIRQLSERICKDNNIKGTSDPMYIANITAYELGLGDGQSSFAQVRSTASEDLDRLTNRINSAYRMNIVDPSNTRAEVNRLCGQFVMTHDQLKTNDYKYIVETYRSEYPKDGTKIHYGFNDKTDIETFFEERRKQGNWSGYSVSENTLSNMRTTRQMVEYYLKQADINDKAAFKEESKGDTCDLYQLRLYKNEARKNILLSEKMAALLPESIPTLWDNEGKRVILKNKHDLSIPNKGAFMSAKNTRNLQEYETSVHNAVNGIGAEVSLTELKEILSKYAGEEFDNLSIKPEDKPEFKEAIMQCNKEVTINASNDLEYHAIGGGFATKYNDKLFIHPLYDRDGNKIDITPMLSKPIDVTNVMAELVKAGIAHEQIGNNASDLYVVVNDISKPIIERYASKEQVKTFKSQIDGKLNYEIAFAYQPAWDEKLKVGTEATAPGLPKICYSKNEETATPILIVKGEKGYSPAPYIADVDAQNKSLGVTKAQEEAMKVGSMFGWNVPGADPKAHGQLDKTCLGYMTVNYTDTKALETLYAINPNGETFVCADIPTPNNSFDKPGRVWDKCDKTAEEIKSTAEYIGNYPLVQNQSPYIFPSLTKEETKELTDFTKAVKSNFPEAKPETLHQLCTIASDMTKYTLQNGTGTLSNASFNALTDAQEIRVKDLLAKDLPGVKYRLDYEPRGAAIKLELPDKQSNSITGCYCVPEIPKNKLTVSPEPKAAADLSTAKKR